MEEMTIITWPEIQGLMEYDWFLEECELINDLKGLEKYGSSAYYVPQKRLDEINKTII